jgi:hypothetical protein
MAADGELSVVRVADVPARGDNQPAWLVEGLWGEGAVGVIGGAPKSCKSWLALEMAAAVASGRPCLGRYDVPKPGPVLVYAAEDAPPDVRERVENLARARGAPFADLEVRLILEPSLRLDRTEDRARLRATLARHRPRLLVLDPYVRLQRGVDENDATQVSAILGALRELSRTFALAIALVHHTRKGGAEDPGEGLRGSGDFWAWGDSNLYVRRRRDGIVLSIEHRAAASPPPVTLALVDGDGPVRLEVREAPPSASAPPLVERIVQSLVQRGPSWQEGLRRALRVRKQDLVDALRDLEAAGRIVRTPAGWAIAG